MIRVLPAPPPRDFDAKVRQPGLRAIAELVGEKPSRAAGKPHAQNRRVKRGDPSGPAPTRGKGGCPGGCPQSSSRLDSMLSRKQGTSAWSRRAPSSTCVLPRLWEPALAPCTIWLRTRARFRKRMSRASAVRSLAPPRDQFSMASRSACMALRVRSAKFRSQSLALSTRASSRQRLPKGRIRLPKFEDGGDVRLVLTQHLPEPSPVVPGHQMVERASLHRVLGAGIRRVVAFHLVGRLVCDPVEDEPDVGRVLVRLLAGQVDPRVHARDAAFVVATVLDRRSRHGVANLPSGRSGRVPAWRGPALLGSSDGRRVRGGVRGAPR